MNPTKTPNDDARRNQLGEKLRKAREYLGLSQVDVARHLGVPRTALVNIESGQRRVDAIELKKLSDLYRQPVGHFTGDDDETAGFAPDVAHLARAAAKLSAKDRDELGRFADYLRARSSSSENKDE